MYIAILIVTLQLWNIRLHGPGLFAVPDCPGAKLAIDLLSFTILVSIPDCTGANLVLEITLFGKLKVKQKYKTGNLFISLQC
jgi:hypothetical protein